MPGNRNGQRGARAERDLVLWLRENGYPDACRARGEGADDRGDIGGIPGVAIQVKSAAKQEYVMPRLRAAQNGALTQAQGRLPVAVVRLPRVTDPGQWWASTPTPYSELADVVITRPVWELTVEAKCGLETLTDTLKASGWVARGDWLVTTCDELFGWIQ